MPPVPSSTTQIVDHLFRHESGRIVSVLSRIFGIDRLGLAEDVVQEALLRALQVWPYKGVPENPPAWIMQVAKNLALDFIRREAGALAKQPQVLELYEREVTLPEIFSEAEIHDDQLRMMFACCHPSIPVEGQIALILKTLCGFGEGEIARAFLTRRETIRKRLTRSKQRLREMNASLDIPDPVRDEQRFSSILQAIYLLFNEGYSASSGESLVRKELCHEAIRLARMLTRHRSGNRPEAHALLALMLLHGSRLNARTDNTGNILLLQKQDRRLWDGAMIGEGLSELRLSAAGTVLSRYHLEAGIAACHCLAVRYEETDWHRILDLYDLLAASDTSPVILLNRAVALSRIHGPDRGIQAVEQLRMTMQLDDYHLLHAVLGEFHAARGEKAIAERCFRRALELTALPSERNFLEDKLKGLEDG